MPNTDLVLLLMAAAILIGAVALAVQAVALLRVARTAQRMKEQFDELAPKAREVLDSAGETIGESRKQIGEVTGRANAILDSAKAQVRKSDDFLTETTQRARIQLDRLELVVDDSISRVHETIMVLNNGVLRPVQQASGVIAGLRTALDYFFRGSRPDVSKATTDEEMFI